MLGLISLDLLGIQGAIIQMVSHGLTAAGLFLMVGMIYERCHTRELAAYGGLAKAAAGVLGVLHDPDAGRRSACRRPAASPASSWCCWEPSTPPGRASRGRLSPLVFAVIAVSGVVLGALYMLCFAQRFLFGASKVPHGRLADLDRREKLILATLLVRSSGSACSPMNRCARPSMRRSTTSSWCGEQPSLSRRRAGAQRR